MEHLTKPSITRLARKAGVKSLSDECHNSIRKIVEQNLNEIIISALVVNSEHNSKTLMKEHIYEALRLLGHNVAQSNDMGDTICSK